MEIMIIKDILFISTILLLSIGIMFIKTDENKVSFVKRFIVSIWTTISIGSVLAFMLNFAHISIRLESMSVMYGVCAAGVWIYLLKCKEKQAIQFYGSEFLCVIFCIIIWGYVFIKTFGFTLSISYANVDAGVHFGMANQIFNSHRLTVFMYFAPLYNGLFMEMLQPILTNDTIYKAFILADASLNLLNLLMFWVLASQFVKSKFSSLSSYVILLMYFLGWPVWSWIAGGFVYFGVGVTVYMYGVYQLTQCSKYFNNKRLLIYHMLLIFMTVFCLIKSYLLFAPVFGITILVYVLYSIRDKLTTKVMVRMLMVAGSVAICAFALIYWGYFGGDVNYILGALRTDGGIFRELYKDFMFILPINVYLCWVKLKTKNIDGLFIAMICQLAITLLVLVAHVAGIVSGYYYFKLYYLGWALQLAGMVQALEYFWNEKKQIICFCILPIVCVAFLELTGINQKITTNQVENGALFPIIADSINYVKEADSMKDKMVERTYYVTSASSWVKAVLGDEEVPMISHLWNPINTWYTAMSNNQFYKIEEKETFFSFLQQFGEANYKYFTITHDTAIFVQQEELLKQYELVYDNNFFSVYLNPYTDEEGRLH